MHKYVSYLWKDAEAQGKSELDLLVYRSRLLGADLRVTNFAGGNTSVKVNEQDPLTGHATEVIYVKASGGDLGTITREGFASLYMDRLRALKKIYRGLEFEDEMVSYLPQCTFNANPAAASIDTPLHAFIPHRHVDHMHPDAIIAVAAAKDGPKLTQEIFGSKVAWYKWQRPGFDLGLELEKLVAAHPGLEGIILASHGLFTWGHTSKECYESTLAVIDRAAAFLEGHVAKKGKVFGGPRHAELPDARRREIAAEVMPFIRGLVGQAERKVGHLDDSADAMEFVDSADAPRLAPLGTSCPDHFLRTKIWPLLVDWDPKTGTSETLKRAIETALPGFRDRYAAYYQRCKRPEAPPKRDANPVVFLVPGVGILTFAKDKATARVSAEYFVNAIHVMRGAEAASSYTALSEADAYSVEYWPLEEAKLRRQPPEKELARRVAVITGGAGGIGKAIAKKFLAAGAHVVLLDIDAGALEKAREELKAGPDRVATVTADVTSETAMRKAFDDACLAFGGVDIVVPNAGIASSAPIESTTLAEWNRNISILETGYFLAAREGFRIMKAQKTGGALVFIASKNALAAGKDAGAYSAAKAAEVHLARCLAVEGAPFGIRVNVVNPDAVLAGSRIWNESSWRAERAKAYGIKPEELEEFYRQRNALKVHIYPDDIAEAVLWFVSDRSAKTTGNMLNVDGGVVAAFPR